MDHSLGIACIGYGSLRMLRTHRYALAPAQTPARLILAEPDPVAFCVEAMGRNHPDWIDRVDPDTGPSSTNVFCVKRSEPVHP